MFLDFLRLIVQLVERAAHNGFGVGSNPTRLISFFIILWILIIKRIKLDGQKNISKTKVFFSYITQLR